MNVVDTYKLIYTGLDQPQHIIQAVKAEMYSSAISNADNARMANYFLDKLDAFNAASAKQQQLTIGENKTSAYREADYVKHIHHAKEDEIRSRFTQPEMSEQEIEKILFEDYLEDQLDQIMDSGERKFLLDLI